MLKKVALTALTAIAITSGASAFTAPEANAGGKFHITIGGGHYGGHYGGYYTPYWGPTCYWKVKRYRVKVWTSYGPKWIWKKRRYRVCY